MTKSNPGTPRHPNEGIRTAHTAVTNRFAELLRSLDASIAAERPLQRDVADVFAPDFDPAFEAAERAREALSLSLSTVISTPEQRPTDRPLRMMAMALKTLISIECYEDRVYLADTLFQNAHLFEVRIARPATKAVRRVQQRFFSGCALLMSMQDFGGPGPNDLGGCVPDLAA